MKTRTLIASIAVAGALILAPAVPATAAAPAPAVAQTGIVMAKVVSFKNCTALHKKYPGGVAKAGVKYNLVSGKKKVAFKVKPKISTALYKANKKLDRDKDGIACEK